MRKIIFTILLIAFCGFNLFAQSEITQEEYDFYTKFIKGDYVVNRFTRNLEPSDIKAAKRKMSKLPKELLGDFNLKNDKPYRIGEKLEGFRFSDQAAPDLSTAKEIVFKFDFIVTVSRIGFTKDKKQALVFSEVTAECCFGGIVGIYWLEFKSGEWKVKKSYQPWIY